MAFLNPRLEKLQPKVNKEKKTKAEAAQEHLVGEVLLSPKEDKSLTIGLNYRTLQSVKAALIKRAQTKDVLTAYAKYFHVLEVSSTFPQFIAAATLKQLLLSPIEEFVFRIEFERDIHLRDLTQHEGLKYLLSLLGSYPGSRYTLVISLSRDIHFDDITCEALSKFIDQLDGPVLAVEAEHWSWGREDAFRDLVAGLRAVVHHDEPKLPGLTARKGTPQMHHKKVQRVVYRLLGRNQTSWLEHAPDRYMYQYTPQDIKDVAKKIEVIGNGRKIVIVSHLPHEEAFRTAELLSRQ